MSRILASATLASLFLAVPAFAEEAKKEEKAEKTVTPYGILQAKYFLTDSSRGDVGTEAMTEIVRAGLKVKHDAARAGLELGYNGNASKLADGTSTGNNTVIIRGAWLGVELPTDTSLKIGRIRPGYASGYGTDATWVPQGYGGVDGLRATQVLTFGDIKLDLGAGVFNSLRSMVYATEFLGSAGTKGAMLSNDWNKSEKAYIVNGSVTFDSIKAQLWYGTEKNAIIGAAYTTTQGTAGKPDAAALNTPNGLTIADLTHIEASLGYDKDNYGAGLFLEQNVVGEARTASLDSKKGKLTTDAKTGTKETSVTVYGVGANLNSKEFGLKDLMLTGDSLSLGVSATTTQIRVKGVSDADQTGKDQRDLSASVSYVVNELDIALVYAHNTSPALQNVDVDGKAVHAVQKTYLNVAWGF